ncbi:Probable superoxide dismutase (Mn) [Mycobacteroides abscessus subsp. abscessus]|nr:Probable superoxide dismutase (Mn) [Mycobacteroides abscessus subsp. abscessus]
MNRFEQYVKEVISYNEELKRFLEQEHVPEEEGLWSKLDHFSEIMNHISRSGDLTQEEFTTVQEKVEELHDEMEAYFSKRQQIGSIYIQEPAVKAGEHVLPKLPYSYDALEPYISEKIMELHHSKHHQSYVDGLNKAEIKLKEAREKGDYSLVKHWSRELAFHGSGHYLHSLFWETMKPNGGGQPTGKLLEEINKYFGHFNAFKKHFTEAAKAVEGSGWAILVWSPRSRHLEILQSEKHMNLTQWDTIPLLPLDVWEHAYYLQYNNNRADYVSNWWNVVNWRKVEERLSQASQIKWKLL